MSRDPDAPGESRDLSSSGSVVSRVQARSHSKKSGQILSYDEIIKGGSAEADFDDFEFRFDIPETCQH